MPWGNKEHVSANVYQHIMSRHRFDYGKRNILIEFIKLLIILSRYLC